MARVIEGPEIVGTITGLTFYMMDGKHYVRMATSLDRNRLRKDPAFEGTRKLYAEFGACSRENKKLRVALNNCIHGMGRCRMHGHVNQLLLKLRDLDTSSPKGKRTIWNGFKHPDAPSVLKGFQFNRKVPLDSIISIPVQWSTTSRTLLLRNLLPSRDIAFPRGIEKVTLKIVMVKADEHTRTFTALEGPVVQLNLHDPQRNVRLSIPSLPPDSGMTLIILSLEFLEADGHELQRKRRMEVNGCMVAEAGFGLCRPILKGVELDEWLRVRRVRKLTDFAAERILMQLVEDRIWVLEDG